MLLHNAGACGLRTISPRTHFWQARHWGLSVEGANRKLEREGGMPHFPSFCQCLQKWLHSWIPSLWYSQSPFRRAQRQERRAVLCYCSISSSFPACLLLPGHLLPGSLPLQMSRAAPFLRLISADVTMWFSILNAFSLEILAWYSCPSFFPFFLHSFISLSPVFVCLFVLRDSHRCSLTGLELTRQAKLVSNSQQSSGFCLLSAEIVSMYHMPGFLLTFW